MGSLKYELKATTAEYFIFYATLTKKGDSTISMQKFCRESMDMLLLKCWNDQLAYSELFEVLAHIG